VVIFFFSRILKEKRRRKKFRNFQTENRIGDNGIDSLLPVIKKNPNLRDVSIASLLSFFLLFLFFFLFFSNQRKIDNN